MLRRVVVAVLASLILLVTPAPARCDAGDLFWEDRIDLAGGNFIQTAIAAAHNRVVAVGSTNGDGTGNGAIAVRAYAAQTGALLWEDRLTTGSATVVMNGLWVIVTGVTVDAAGLRHGVVRAYVARTGELIWQDTWPDGAEPHALDMDAPGLAAVVSGIAGGASTGAGRLFVRAYAARNGALLWEDQPVPSGYSSVFTSTSRSVAVRGTKAFVGAKVRPSACLIRAYDIVLGTVLWETVRPRFLSCTPAAVATNGKQVLISGSAGEFDVFFVQSYDAETGQFLWEQRADVGNPAFTNAAIAVDTEGKNVFVAGWYLLPHLRGLKEAFVVRSYDAETGALRWVDEFAHPEVPPFFYLLHAYDLAVTRGRVIAVGQNISGTGAPWLTRAYDAETGALLWSSAAEVAPLAAPYGALQAVAVDHERIFVAGSGRNNTQGHADFIIRALDAQ